MPPRMRVAPAARAGRCEPRRERSGPRMRQHYSHRPLPSSPSCSVPGHAAEVITHYAKAHSHDLIVVGHRGHFLGD
jgi:nucleotide-binding universal stress UspA family protein